MEYKIITDEAALKIPCDRIKSLKEGEEIANILFDMLTKIKKGIGLAANQIGINKRVCVLQFKAISPSVAFFKMFFKSR